MEIWKPVRDYEDLYEVSNLGRIKCLDRYVVCERNNKFIKMFKKGCIKKPFYNKETGYYTVNLNKEGKSYTTAIHVIVAEAFCEKPITNEKLVVNHKNGRKLDNRANNLEWVTYAKNNKHAYDYGLKVNTTRKKIYCVELNKTFNSANEAAIFIKDTYNIQSELATIRGNIRTVTKKQHGTSYKYHWKHI